MQSDEEIKKEFAEKFNIQWRKGALWEFGGCEECDLSPQDVADFFLSKFQTLQEEYKKQIEERQKLFNFIPQDEYGYKRIKTSDLDIINIINS